MTGRGQLVLVSVVVGLIGTSAGTAAGVIEGPQMVGVGLPADTLNYDRSASKCTYDTVHTYDPAFAERESFEHAAINYDIHLLVSQTLSGSLEVTQAEVESLLQTFDWRTDNEFDEDEKDLELIFNYLSFSEAYSDSGFLAFPSCDTIPEAERDHVDFYLVKYGDDDDSDVGSYTSLFKSALEDLPTSAAFPEYHWNSFHITDGGGNEGGDPSWPQRAAVGAGHEFGHMLWASNAESLGTRAQHGNFNELHAGVATYIARATWGPIGGYDVPYAQSLLYLFYGGGGGRPPCLYVREGSVHNCDTSFADLEDCMTGYRTRALFIAYLMEHFHEGDYTDDLLYQWARVREGGDGLLIRDMCGLARVLDDDNLYSDLGGDPPRPGDYRVRKVFHNYSVAKWLDDGGESEYYSFGDDFSPTENAGLFAKIDTVKADTVNCWERTPCLPSSS